MTLYLDLGGRPAILRAVRRLENRLQLDPVFMTTAHRLDSDHNGDFIEFLSYLLGGAPFYEGYGAKAMLGPFCDCDATFDHFVDHLVTVLLGHTGSSPHETDIRKCLERLRPVILPPDTKRTTTLQGGSSFVADDAAVYRICQGHH